VDFIQGIGEIEALSRKNEIHLQPAMASSLAAYMNENSENPFQHIMAIYWSVSPAALRGLLDHVRTALTKLVAELRAEVPAGDEVPAAAADHAVQYVISGKRPRVNITTAQASGPNAVATSAGNDVVKESSEGLSVWRKLGAGLVGLATIAAAVFAGIQIF
jgi:hypothetical protein